MAEEYDEWDVFGSDDDDDDDDDDVDVDDDVDHGVDHDTNDDNNRNINGQNDEIAKKDDQNQNDHLDSSSLDKATDEVSLFIAKEFIMSCRCIPLTQRYMGIPASMNASTVKGDSRSSTTTTSSTNSTSGSGSGCNYNNGHGHGHGHGNMDALRTSWYNSMSHKLGQRGMKIESSLSSPLSSFSSSPLSSPSPYTCDGGVLFSIFEQRHTSTISATTTTTSATTSSLTSPLTSPLTSSSSIELQDVTKTTSVSHGYESHLRKTIVKGGFILVTMYILNNTNNPSTTQTSAIGTAKIDIPFLLSQWKHQQQHPHQQQPIFNESIWDIEHASIVSHLTSSKNHNRSSNDNHGEIITIRLTKRPCPVNTLSCPWKNNKRHVPLSFYNEEEATADTATTTTKKLETWLDYERRIVADATISLSMYELNRLKEQDQTSQKTQNNTPSTSNSNSNSNSIIMTKENIKKAIQSLETYGFVILPSLFTSQKSMHGIHSWSNAIMSDFHSACDILKSSSLSSLNHHKVDIFNPGKEETFDPISYREMAMREDLRVDLRDGPCLKQVRTKERKNEIEILDGISFRCVDDNHYNDNDDEFDGTIPTIIDSKRKHDESTNHKNKSHEQDKSKSLRFNPNVLEIVQKLFNPIYDAPQSASPDYNPRIPLYKGNFGRYNFNGSGPDGSAQCLRVGQIGSVISLPRAGDQAIHADTPHLFELYDCLPCHYANLFILGDGGGSNCNSNGGDGGESKEENGKYDSDGNYTGDNLIGKLNSCFKRNFRRPYFEYHR
jgi:hypothetical protein